MTIGGNKMFHVIFFWIISGSTFDELFSDNNGCTGCGFSTETKFDFFNLALFVDNLRH